MLRGRRNYTYISGVDLGFIGWNEPGGMGSAPTGTSTGGASTSTSSGGGGGSTGVTGTSAKWYGGVLTPNGDVYGFPSSSSTTIKYLRIAQDNTISTVGPTLTASQRFNFKGGVCHNPTAKLFSVSYSNPVSICVFDTNTHTLNEHVISTITGDHTPIIGPDGLVHFLYMATKTSNTILFRCITMNPVTETYSIEEFDLTPVSTSGVDSGGVFSLHSTGKVYGFSRLHVFEITLSPFSVTKVLQFSTNTSISYNSICVAPNGKFYMQRNSGPTIIVYDPATNTSQTIDYTSYRTSTTARWLGIVLGANGNLFVIPSVWTDLIELNPDTLAITRYNANYTDGSDFAAIAKWAGGVQRDNNTVLTIPKDGTRVMAITMPSAPTPTGWQHSPYAMHW